MDESNREETLKKSAMQEECVAETTDIPLKPRISVIVPIYNVEKYVRRCLDSLVNQTLREIEIICIDDGSTDSSGTVADEYKNEEGWPLIRVIHTQNRGLSAARNRGIDEARAEWIMFVDSDDWVEPRFCEIPYETAIENDADLVIFEEDRWKNGRKLKNKKSKSIPTGHVDELTTYDYGSVVAWNKHYNRVLFDTVRYPEGRVYEDYATTHKLVHEAKKIILVKDCLYHYTLRKGSISHIRSIKYKKDCFISTKERCTFLAEQGYSESKLKSALCGSALGLLSVMDPCADEVYMEARSIVNLTKGIPKTMSKRQKAGLIIWRINPLLFHLLCRFIN